MAAAGARSLRVEGEGGVVAELSPFGATLVRLLVPDRAGRPGDVVLGFDDPAAYRGPHPFLGCIVGRYANRIGRARFRLDGREMRLTPNEGLHHLHGGPRGLHRVAWSAEPVERPGARGVRFRHRSPAGDEGYPGELEVEAAYWLCGGGELRIEMRARTDAPTVVSLASHAYFNLRDGGAGDVLDHELEIAADGVLAVDGERIPTGEVLPVRGGALDFTAPRAIGARIAETAGGYDHCFVLRGPAGRLRTAARLRDPLSGRGLELATTEPALQLYTANGLGPLSGRGGAVYRRHHGVCLEAQRLPDAPNHPEFPSARLDPGSVYEQITVLRFSAA
jgi:aldose 1-epimerase